MRPPRPAFVPALSPRPASDRETPAGPGDVSRLSSPGEHGRTVKYEVLTVDIVQESGGIFHFRTTLCCLDVQSNALESGTESAQT